MDIFFSKYSLFDGMGDAYFKGGREEIIFFSKYPLFHGMGDAYLKDYA